MNMAKLVCEAAQACPDKRALVDEQGTYTFAELDSLSSRFAAFLLSNGVQIGDRIAFCFPKNASLVVAILGCLKAGAIYVPVDSKMPKDRILFILNDVCPRFIVSGLTLYHSVSLDLKAPCILIEADRLPEYFRHNGEGHNGEGAVLPQIAHDDVAYCIYTSGSTGRPKGVLIEHHSVSVFFRVLADVMPIEASCRCMNTSELYFDVHIMDLFFPLHRGATVHLSRGPLIANKLLQTIEQERITHFTAVGPLMTLMTEGSLFYNCDLSSLVRVMTGAEIVNVNTMQKWLEKVPGLSLVNGYGPTEATVICTAYIIDRIEPSRTDFYPIGKPLRGTEVLLFDEGRIISKPYVKGELLIAGQQVMKGYWNDEENTQKKVITVAGKRCYRSGDVCRWLPDGNLDYVGRIDEQVKLSGFRIDLSEIKRVMDATTRVREGHPIVTVHPALGKVIAACFTRDDEGDELDDDGIFTHLQSAFKQELPYYMVPSLYFLFENFPKLASGKTDKKQILNNVNKYLDNVDTGLTRFVCREKEPVS